MAAVDIAGLEPHLHRARIDRHRDGRHVVEHVHTDELIAREELQPCRDAVLGQATLRRCALRQPRVRIRHRHLAACVQDAIAMLRVAGIEYEVRGRRPSRGRAHRRVLPDREVGRAQRVVREVIDIAVVIEQPTTLREMNERHHVDRCTRRRRQLHVEPRVTHRRRDGRSGRRELLPCACADLIQHRGRSSSPRPRRSRSRSNRHSCRPWLARGRATRCCSCGPLDPLNHPRRRVARSTFRHRFPSKPYNLQGQQTKCCARAR